MPAKKIVVPVKSKKAAVNVDTKDPYRAYLMEYGLAQGLKVADVELLFKIIQAESGWGHYTSSGKVKTSYTNDVGFGQINVKFHLARTIKMGLDIYKPYDNLKYVVYLYKTSGTGPWNASKARWNA